MFLIIKQFYSLQYKILGKNNWVKRNKTYYYRKTVTILGLYEEKKWFDELKKWACMSEIEYFPFFSNFQLFMTRLFKLLFCIKLPPLKIFLKYY